jgi:hypothetical protein
MPHLDEGTLHELLDGEIPSSDLPPIQAHLAACAECRARLEEARALAGAADQLIETIELTEPPAPRAAVIPSHRPARRWGRDLAWAATVIVAVGAGYLVRGSSRPPDLALTDSAVPAAAPTLPPAPLESSTTAEPDRAAERERRTDAPAPTPPRQALANDAANAIQGAASGRKRVEAAAASPDSARRKIGDTRFALEEIVTTAMVSKAAVAESVVAIAAGQAAGPSPATPPAARSAVGARLQQAPAANELRLDQEGKVSTAAKREATPVEITFPEALRRLSGTLRLIEGLVPVRLEVVGTEVRVVYPLTSGELALEQWLVDGRVNYRLVAPRDFPTDSLERLRERVRE